MELNFSTSPISPKNENQKSNDLPEDNQVQLQAEQEDLQRQQTCLFIWNHLQGEIQQLHELFVEFNKVVYVSLQYYF